MPTADVVTADVRVRDRASADLQRVESRFKSMARSGVAAAARLAPSFAIAGTAFIAFAKKAIVASAKQQTIMNQLRGALGRVGESYDAQRSKISTFTSEMQNTTRFGDDQMAATLTMLTNLTGTFGDSTLDAARVVADFAEGGMMPLNSATRLVSQAISGNLSALSRYIPSIKDLDAATFKAMTTTERTAVVVGELSAKFGGAAKDISSSEQGLANLANTAGDVQEAYGKMWLEIGKGAGSTGWVIDALKWTEDFYDMSKVGKVAFEDEAEAVREFAIRLRDSAVSVEEFNTWQARFKAAGVDAQEMLKEYPVALSAYNIAMQRSADATREAAEATAARAAEAKRLLDIQNEYNFSEEAGLVITTNYAALQRRAAEAMERRKRATEAALDMQVAMIDLEHEGLQQEAAGAAAGIEQPSPFTFLPPGDEMADAVEKFKELEAAAKDLADMERQVQEQSKAMAASMAASFVTSATAAIASGDNIAENFFGVIASNLQTLGGAMIASGFASMALGPSAALWGLSPPQLIGSGIALTAIGAGLGSQMGGGGGGGGGRRSGGGGGAASSFSGAGERAAEPENRGSVSNITLTFGGQRLHTDEEIGKTVEDVLRRFEASSGRTGTVRSDFRR